MKETAIANSLREIVLRGRLALGCSARELAKRIGVSHSYVSQIERGIICRPSLLVLKRLTQALPAISYADLLSASGYCGVAEEISGAAQSHERQRAIAERLWEVAGELTRQAADAGTGEFRSLPLLSSVPASFGVAAAESLPQNDCESAHIHESRLRGDAGAYALRVHGDSMADAGILEGDIVVVSPRSQWKSGDICVVRLNGGEYSIKRVVAQGELIILQPCNSRYEPLAVSPECQGELHICGKVIHCERSFP